jgi:hypothetical protein
MFENNVQDPKMEALQAKKNFSRIKSRRTQGGGGDTYHLWRSRENRVTV